MIQAHEQDHERKQGCTAFLADVRTRVKEATANEMETKNFVLQSARRYSNIDVNDAIRRPKQFLVQISGSPPVCFGTPGFVEKIVDDQEPARHYTAFVFVGYWLPKILAIPVLWAWEFLGMIRYGHWSQPDVRSGYIGIDHGRAIRKQGFTLWPELIERDLKA